MEITAKRIELAYDDHGAGAPVVMLHGLTFDRTTWRPIIDRLGAGMRSLAIDLPGHGETGGPARSVSEVADLVHALLDDLGIERPVIVGHSMSGAIASVYGATYPVLGVVNIDNPVDVRPFAQLVHRLAPALDSPGFAAAFEPFQQSMGLDLVPEPLRSHVLAIQDARAALVLGYWDQIIRSDPNELQAWIDESLRCITAPYLAIFGHALDPAQRDYIAERITGLQLEEWPGGGHFVHLSHVERFTARLHDFIQHCLPQ